MWYKYQSLVFEYRMMEGGCMCKNRLVIMYTKILPVVSHLVFPHQDPLYYNPEHIWQQRTNETLRDITDLHQSINCEWWMDGGTNEGGCVGWWGVRAGDKRGSLYDWRDNQGGGMKGSRVQTNGWRGDKKGTTSVTKIPCSTIPSTYDTNEQTKPYVTSLTFISRSIVNGGWVGEPTRQQKTKQKQTKQQKEQQ